MIDYTLDTDHAILIVRPHERLADEDFAALTAAADPFIESHGALAGLIIDAAKFPGWKNFGAMVAHFKFVRDHHKHIKKVAAVTDSPLGEVAENLASHFVAAEIKHFPAGEVAAAKAWITGEA
jgi:hypothetical protein